MLIRKIAGCTHDIGKDQGYLNLPIRVTPHHLEIAGATHQTVLVESAWEPNPEELEKLNAGESVIVQLVGALPHPPIRVYVDSGDTPVHDSISSLQAEVIDLIRQMQVKAKEISAESREKHKIPSHRAMMGVYALEHAIDTIEGIDWP